MRLTEAEVVELVEQVTTRRLRVWVRRGWLSPAAGEEGLVFDELDVARIRLVCELKADMNLNDDAVPVVLSLIDQLHGMRREMKGLTRAIEAQPEEVRRRIGEAYRRARET